MCLLVMSYITGASEFPNSTDGSRKGCQGEWPWAPHLHSLPPPAPRLPPGMAGPTHLPACFPHISYGWVESPPLEPGPQIQRLTLKTFVDLAKERQPVLVASGRSLWTLQSPSASISPVGRGPAAAGLDMAQKRSLALRVLRQS